MRRFWIIVLLLGIVSATYAQALTVAQALAIGNELEHEGVTSESYTIEGYVNVITDNQYSSSYNNMTFWIADTRGTKSSSANGALQVYRGRPNQELVEGDKVRVVAKLKKYYSTIETTPYNVPVTWLESAPEKPVLDTIKGSLRVCAQNLENYYFNFNSGRGNYTQEEFDAKTQKIVNAMIKIDADIFAFCELEAQPIILEQLADSMNKRVPDNRYVSVSDGIAVEWSEEADYNLKSGFIYRKDKVKTIGSSFPGTPGNGYYSHTMRIQTFEELASGERLTVSMNHFKSKIGGGDDQRITNANNLVEQLPLKALDDDILILGDLNCEYGEEPITIIQNAGYEEQILRYDSSAFSHCYGGGELIDHVFANESMREQIVCAYVKHVSAYACNPKVSEEESYADHDPYVVEINLAKSEVPDECQDLDKTYLTANLSGMTTEGDAAWIWDTYNGDSYAKVSKPGGYTGYLMTPEFDLTRMKSASLSFKHAHKFAGTPSQELTLWVTSNYQGSFADSEWQQLTISPYTSNSSWTFADVSINVPTSTFGPRTVFAFKYMSTASNYATWEIKNLNITAQCADTPTDIDSVQPEQCAIKTIENGQLIITLPDGSRYNVIGIRIR